MEGSLPTKNNKIPTVFCHIVFSCLGYKRAGLEKSLVSCSFNKHIHLENGSIPLSPVCVSQDSWVHAQEHRHLRVTGADVCLLADAVLTAMREWMCNAALIPAKEYNVVPLGTLFIVDEHIPFLVKHIHFRKKCIDHLLKPIYYSKMCTSTNETHRS